MDFYLFKKDVETAFYEFIKDKALFQVDISKEVLWDTYLLSFDDEVELQEHDCIACKSFIYHYGRIVTINSITYEIETFWDNIHNFEYKSVIQRMAQIVKNSKIENIFIQNPDENYGYDHNFKLLPNGEFIKLDHLYVKIPDKYRFKPSVHHFSTIIKYKENVKTKVFILKCSILEITNEAIETVIKLIESKTLYKGEKFLKDLQFFLKLKKEAPIINIDNYCWFNYNFSFIKIRNTAIGTLLVNLSKNKDLEESLKNYEFIMVPMSLY